MSQDNAKSFGELLQGHLGPAQHDALSLARQIDVAPERVERWLSDEEVPTREMVLRCQAAVRHDQHWTELFSVVRDTA